jgi:dihydrofolate synthase/folylpolyglutamate synthase
VPRPASQYKEELAWLYGLQLFGIKLGLENIQRLIAALHLDLGSARVVHVAGTNGKGSVCAMIDSICRAAGYRTGLFTSPHLVTFRERVKVNGEMISENCVAENLSAIRHLVRDWDPHPTFFEIATALALRYFNDPKIDILILETGMGGRLDATNAVQSNVSVITPIDLDHQKWLGDTIEKIAAEKAGIIKPHVPVVSASQLPDAEKVIRSRASECEAPLQFVTESYPGAIALAGDHQKQNAALAIAALRAAKIDPPSQTASPARTSGATGIDEFAIARGLESVEWPARFQRWDERTIIDGAHNPSGAKILAQTWRELFGDERATLILAVLADKDTDDICRALAPITQRVLLPKIRTERALAPEELAQILSANTPSLQNASPVEDSPWRARTSVASSFADALDEARKESAPILITGSLHFAGEALATLQGVPAAFEECAQ